MAPHFKSLLNPVADLDGEFIKEVENYLQCHDQSVSPQCNAIDDFLSDVTTDEEVMQVMNNLKNDKAPVEDGITAECYKALLSYIVPYLTSLFNKVFNSGYFPKAWCLGLIVPLYKKGNTADVNNYRGISTGAG